MSKKVYGIDLDGVVFDFCSKFIDVLNEEYGSNVKYSDITNYYWYECFEWLTKEEFWDTFHEFGKKHGYAKLDFYDGAKEGLSRLITSGANVHIVTHRPDYAHLDTLWSVGLNFKIPQEKVRFSKGTKSWDVEHLGINVFIDDAKHNVFDVAENTEAKVYIMDQPYNQGFEHPRVTRVKDWNEFLEAEKIYG